MKIKIKGKGLSSVGRVTFRGRLFILLCVSCKIPVFWFWQEELWPPCLIICPNPFYRRRCHGEVNLSSSRLRFQTLNFHPISFHSSLPAPVIFSLGILTNFLHFHFYDLTRSTWWNLLSSSLSFYILPSGPSRLVTCHSTSSAWRRKAKEMFPSTPDSILIPSFIFTTSK